MREPFCEYFFLSRSTLSPSLALHPRCSNLEGHLLISLLMFVPFIKLIKSNCRPKILQINGKSVTGRNKGKCDRGIYRSGSTYCHWCHRNILKLKSKAETKTSGFKVKQKKDPPQSLSLSFILYLSISINIYIYIAFFIYMYMDRDISRYLYKEICIFLDICIDIDIKICLC
jgi:hypothetical protein